MPENVPAAPRRFPIWESAATILAIASLWPAYILGWKGLVWHVLSAVMLAAMVVVLVRRLLAFERLKEETAERRRKGGEADKQGRARLPWEQ